MGKKLTQEEFIEKSIKKHGDKYDYSQVDYVDSKTHVNIICKEHGVFPQSPSKHLFGRGCRKCNNDKIAERFKLTTEEFISKSIAVHGDEYNYSKVKYVNNSTDVIIGCKVHGDFKQRPANHMFGATCLKCSRDKAAIEKTKTKEEFVRDSIKVHGDKYDYSLVKYTNCKDPIDVICKVHGIFETTPDNLLQKRGCVKCTNDLRLDELLVSFISRAKKIHNDKYNYDFVKIKGVQSKVEIICPIHGVFEQTPANHLQGNGCDTCNRLVNIYQKSEYIKLSETATLYLIKVFKDEECFYKIGKTKNRIDQRFSRTNIKPYSYEIINEYFSDSGSIFDLEIELHKKYYKYKHVPEHKFAGHTECYKMSLPINEIINL